MQLIPNQISFSTYKNELSVSQGLTIRVARFDKIHPLLSGNKIFKLSKYLEYAKVNNIPHLVTLGGAYSNHLVATAYACKASGLYATGIVRGEEAADHPAHTIQQCIELGMQIIFVSRQDYSKIDSENLQEFLTTPLNRFVFIPEGGYQPTGAQGAAIMMDYLQEESITHIITAVGTATTVAGLLLNNPHQKKIIAVPVIKNMHDLPSRIQYLTQTVAPAVFTIWDEYHLGGYAKKNDELFHFMNKTFEEQKIPTDFIYTAKMLYALQDKLSQDYFPAGSHIVAVHSGGLQGNLSLPSGVLNF